MHVLITGNMGYVGPAVISQFRRTFKELRLTGFDLGYFAHCLTGTKSLPETQLDAQLFGDVRTLDPQVLKGVDAVVHLAALSNDPMGNVDEQLTLDINAEAAIRTARLAKEAGAKAFVFASSCSVYGFAESGECNESSQVNPLTAYARSKVRAEQGCLALADDTFKVTCLRFATACGMSARLRLDLVLNDFVAGALSQRKISILSDGTPWRPLIDTQDMARAFEWGVIREVAAGGPGLVINVGTNASNYQVRELAEAVQKLIPGLEVTINKDAPADKRSYRVSFDLYTKLAPNHLPQVSLANSIGHLRDGLQAMRFSDAEFRSSDLIRLKALTRLREQGQLTQSLTWKE
jgi:nucleoside-diphosphate-sugar epimerase